MLISRGEGGLLSKILSNNSGHHNKFLSSEWNQSLQVQSNPPFLVLILINLFSFNLKKQNLKERENRVAWTGLAWIMTFMIQAYFRRIHMESLEHNVAIFPRQFNLHQQAHF